MTDKNERRISMSAIDADASTDEKRKTGAKEFFEAWDENMDGKIDQDEFAAMYDMIHNHVRDEHAREFAQDAKLQRSRRRTKCWAGLVILTTVLLAMSIAGNALAVFFIVDNNVRTTAASSGVMNVKGTDQIAQTAEATTMVPLIAAPLLPDTLLDRLKSVRVTRQCGTREQYTVTGFTWYNATSMVLHTIRGDRIELYGNEATLVMGNNATYEVCEADVTCAALTVTESEIDVDALMAQLPQGRRKLASRCFCWP